MSLDALALGSCVFTDFAAPELLPGGGKQQMRVHKLPGGDRYIDTMGPDDDDRQFDVLHVGASAQDDVLTLDQMRISGQPWPYSNGMEARTVVISALTWRVEKFNVIHTSLTLTPVDNPSGSGTGTSSLDSLVGSDLSGPGGAQASAEDNIANSTPVTTPIGSGGIGSA